MAPKTIQTTVGFTDPANNVLANGTLALDLFVAAEIIGGGQVVPTRLSFPLDATGKIAASSIWANDQLIPSGTVYIARLFNSNGLLVSGPVAWSIQGASPIDLSQETPVSTTLSLPAPILQTPAGPQTITGQDLIDTVYMRAKRFRVDQGSALVAGDFALGGSWGTSPSISVIGGTDGAFRVNITSGSGSPGANPTITITFHDGGWPAIPTAVATMGGGFTSGQFWAITATSTTQITFTFIGTPSASTVYGLNVIVMGD